MQILKRELNQIHKKVISKRIKMPDFISPMLATLMDRPFTSDDWLFEIKWDGFRALAFINSGKVLLKSRENHLFNKKFPRIIKNLEKIDHAVILDGELVVVNSKGKPSFQNLQNYQREGKGTLVYYVFDLLYKDGEDLRQLPLMQRKEMLKHLLKERALPLIKYSDHILREGESFFKKASEMKLEGIIGKQVASTYQSKRSKNWVKIKTVMRQEVVIGGFTAPRGSRKKFGALLVGVYNDRNELHYVGRVGGGFNEALLDEVLHQLKPFIQKQSPFSNQIKAKAGVTWVKPKILCEVTFTEWTKENVMRQPIFQGLRQDKNPKVVKKEIPVSTTNLNKIYWPGENYTKKDLLDYYTNIAPFILPYLKDRPIVLHRFPDGIEGSDFYQKNIDFPHDKWIKTFPLRHEGKVVNYLLINNVKSLLYAVNLGSIDLHPFMSRIKKLESPDYCVIDLDPQMNPFKIVVEVALVMHEILQEAGIVHYCKTSGGKGLHIFIPLHGKYSYEQSRQFAEIISHLVHKKIPKITSLERNPQKREKKVYLDYLQNRMSNTIVATYCVRPRPKALVSTPITWEEVNKDLDPSAFNINTIPTRLKEIGDIFKLVLGAGINIKNVLLHLRKYGSLFIQ